MNHSTTRGYLFRTEHRHVTTMLDKATRFRALHAGTRAFIIPNPWDVGSARLLQRLGFEALATTSAGFAFSVGQRDNSIGRDQMLAHATAIAKAVDVPVSADLEEGFGSTASEVAETFRRVGATGLAGGSVEDAIRDGGGALYAHDEAADRVRAAVEAVRAFPYPFTLTARCENFLVGTPDLADTIRRLQLYQEAGADVLYAPGLSTAEEIATVTSAVDRPVNFLHTGSFTLAQLDELGVRRVSVGSTLSRAAYGALIGAATEMKERGTFEFAAGTIGFGALSEMFPS